MENILSEYDKSPGIISPDFEKMDLHLPKRAVLLFLERNGLKGLFLPGTVKKPGHLFL